jgi:hypothetical protein
MDVLAPVNFKMKSMILNTGKDRIFLKNKKITGREKDCNFSFHINDILSGATGMCFLNEYKLFSNTFCMLNGSLPPLSNAWDSHIIL